MTGARVSCLSVARATLPRVKESLRAYCEQTYPDRELILASAGPSRSRQALAEYVESLGRPDVRTLETAGAPEAALQEAATGDLLCAWSATDSSHPLRLQRQVESLSSSGAGACVFADWLWLIRPERELWWMAGREPGGAISPAAAGALLARREDFPEALQRLRHGTGRAGDPGISRLAGAGALLVTISDAPVPREIAAQASESADLVRRQRGLLRTLLPGHRLPGPYLVHARDAAGAIATFDPFEEH